MLEFVRHFHGAVCVVSINCALLDLDLSAIMCTRKKQIRESSSVVNVYRGIFYKLK